MLNDYYEPPFEAFLDTARWLIKWPMRGVDNGLLDYLRAVPAETLDEMVRAAHQDRCWYLYNPSAVDNDNLEVMKGHGWKYEKVFISTICPDWRTRNAFMGVMRMLLRKRRKSRTSPYTFYAPGS